jgi:hypothetical protein
VRRSIRRLGGERDTAAGFGDVVSSVETMQADGGVAERGKDLVAGAGVGECNRPRLGLSSSGTAVGAEIVEWPEGVC